MSSSTQKKVRDALASEISRRFYESTPAYKALCDDILHLAPEDVPMDHTAIRFVDRKATDEVAFLAEALGMRDQGVSYTFPDKKLVARSFGVPGENAADEFKIYATTLDHEAFSDTVQTLLAEDEASSPHRISDVSRNLLSRLKDKEALTDEETDTLIAHLFDGFFIRKTPIKEATFEAIGKESPVAQVGATCAGELNHATPYINKLKDPYNDIEYLANAMKDAGIAMASDHVQGLAGSPLRQTSSQAQSRQVTVLDSEGKPKDIMISNEYVEIAERGPSLDSDGNPTSTLYGGFMVEQATNIYLSNVDREN